MPDAEKIIDLAVRIQNALNGFSLGDGKALSYEALHAIEEYAEMLPRLAAFEEGRMRTHWRCPAWDGKGDVHALDLASLERMTLYEWREQADPKEQNQAVPRYGVAAICTTCGWQGHAYEAVEWREDKRQC